MSEVRFPQPRAVFEALGVSEITHMPQLGYWLQITGYSFQDNSRAKRVCYTYKAPLTNITGKCKIKGRLE